MSKYDLQDPTDLDIMRGQFNMYTADDWQEYIDQAEEQKIGYKNINILKTAQRKAGIAKYLSPKVIDWVLRLVDQIDAADLYDEEEQVHFVTNKTRIRPRFVFFFVPKSLCGKKSWTCFSRQNPRPPQIPYMAKKQGKKIKTPPKSA